MTEPATITDRYARVTPERARLVIAAGVCPSYAEARDMIGGDHWRKGEGWAGSQPYRSGVTQAIVLAEIERAFVSANKAAEVAGRHVAGVVGRAPAWRYTPRRALQPDEAPTGGEAALIAEAEALMTAWWDRVQLPRVLADALPHTLAGGAACLRLYIPSAYLDRMDDGTPILPPGDMAEQLARIEVEALGPDRARVAKDPATGRDVALVRVPPAAGLFDDPTGATDDVELHSLADDGMTVIRTLGTDGAAVLPLAGRLLVAQIERSLFLSPQVLSMQRALNFSLTMMQRNNEQAGSAERWALGALPPGEYVDAPDGSGSKVFKAAPVVVGPGTTNFLQGTPVYGDAENPDTVTTYTTPSIQRIDPVPVDTFTATQDTLYAAILGETGQRHALISGDAAASGESRIQARAEFEASLRPTAEAVQGALRAILEACLALAAYAAGQAGRYDALRADVTCLLDTGPASGLERQQNREDVAAGLLSEETAMARGGVDDVAAEREKIAAEREERQARAPQIAPVVAVAPTAEEEEEVTA
jgi:hypothetical protein